MASLVDKSLMNINDLLCENISRLSSVDAGFMSQNILASMRTFVEHVIVKLVNDDTVDPDNYDVIQASILKINKSDKKLHYIANFHRLLKISESHYTSDKDGAERLLFSYMKYLLKIKVLFQEKYNMCFLL